MKDRQNAHKHVVVPKPKYLIHSPDVRADVAVGEHDSLRPAGGAGRENNRQQVVVAKLRQPQPAFKLPHGHKPRRRGGGEFVGQRDLILEVLQVHQFGIQLSD